MPNRVDILRRKAGILWVCYYLAANTLLALLAYRSVSPLIHPDLQAARTLGDCIKTGGQFVPLLHVLPSPLSLVDLLHVTSFLYFSLMSMTIVSEILHENNKYCLAWLYIIMWISCGEKPLVGCCQSSASLQKL